MSTKKQKREAVVKKEKLGDEVKVKTEIFDQETDDEEEKGGEHDSALKRETDDEEEVKGGAAVKEETDDEVEADDELKRLQNEIERAIAVLEAKEETQEASGRYDDDEIVEFDKKLRQAQHNRHVAERIRRNESYKRNPKQRESDEKTLYWCENRFDNDQSFLILPKLKYYDWRDFRACPTWGDMRSQVSKDFYENAIMKRLNELIGRFGTYDDHKEQLKKASEDETPFYCGTRFRKSEYEGMVGDLFCDRFGETAIDDRFPPFIEQIMYEEYDSSKKFDWLLKRSKLVTRFEFDLSFQMNDKEDIFRKIEALGFKTEHEPDLLNLTTTARSNETFLYEVYGDESDFGP